MNTIQVRCFGVVRAVMLGASLLMSAVSANASLIGARAPDFTLADNLGNSVSLEDFAGTGVILDFCALWCRACQDFYNDASLFPSLDPAVRELVLPLVLQDRFLRPSEQADAQLWVDTFGTGIALHVSGSQVLIDSLIDDFFPGQNSIGLPTFFFVDAQLNIVEVFAGLQPNVIFTNAANQIIASRVPVPATFALVGLGLLGFGLKRRA